MTDTSRVQKPLNLVLPIEPKALVSLKQLLAKMDRTSPKPVHVALERLGNVHFAQFVFLEQETRLGVLTLYDGDFDEYILSFVESIGDIFNAILMHIQGGQAVTPVQTHREQFLEFIRAHNHAGLGVFSAYPGRRAYDIKDALELL